MGADLGYMALIALGTMKLTELYKELYRRYLGNRQVGVWKSLISLGFAVALTLAVPDRDIRVKLLIAVGAWGLSALLHALDTVLRSHRDDMVASVYNRQNARRH
jgi:hypothetical protein